MTSTTTRARPPARPRATTNGAAPYFAVRRSPIQGRGVFAARPIPKGARIVEYTGEKISWSESDRRYDDASMVRHHTFLFILSTRTVIDAAVGGNEARFINHSCAPNCEAVIEGGRIWIEAVRRIRTGEELSYDYSYERSGDESPADEVLYRCRCGTRRCRGTILLPPKRSRPAARRAVSAEAARGDRRRASSGRTAS